jgi:outer membrane protein
MGWPSMRESARLAGPGPATEVKGFMKTCIRLVMAVVMAASTATAIAQEVSRLGFVNTERILRESNAAKAAQSKLEQEFAKRDKELQETATRLRQMGERLERDATVMSESDRLKRQREVAEMDKDFQRRQREFREDLNQRRNEELALVIERANRVIKQLAEQEKYDLILQDAVYASPRIDITEKVLRALNAAK